MALSRRLIGFVKASKNRDRILFALSAPKRPVDLAKELKLHRSHAARAFRQLEEKGLTKCLTPNTPNYKLYSRTPKGDQLVKQIKKLFGR